MGRCGSGGRAVVWQSEGCRFDSTLGVSKCPWARHLTPNCSWRAGWYLAWQPIAVGVWMCVWMGEWEAKIVKRFGYRRYINAVHLPFTIYLPLGQYLKSSKQLELLQTCLNEDPCLCCPHIQRGGKIKSPKLPLDITSMTINNLEGMSENNLSLQM